MAHKDEEGQYGGEEAGGDCTNFAYQSILAGIDSFYAANMEAETAWTDTLYRYLTDESAWQNPARVAVAPTTNTGYVAQEGDIEFIGDTLIKAGDVAFYRQPASEYHNVAYFTHAAVVVGWGPAQQAGQEYQYTGSLEVESTPPNATVPHIVEHSGSSLSSSPRPIHQTNSVAEELVVVHVPDVLYLGDYVPIEMCEATQ